jgi:hypothetical protein
VHHSPLRIAVRTLLLAIQLSIPHEIARHFYDGFSTGELQPELMISDLSPA